MCVACVRFALLRVNRQDGKTVDLSEIVDVRLEFDDPTLVLVRLWHHGKVCGLSLSTTVNACREDVPRY
jgi:hypothetical protein